MLTQNTFQFLDDLQANNNTEWMHENKKWYELYKKDYHSFIAEVLTEMKPLDASLEPLEVKNCTFRINRDIRFSKNKEPYKTNMGVWIAQSLNRKNSPGYYIHYEKGNSFVAGGLWCPEPEQLKKVRTEISFFNDDLIKILQEKNFKKEFGDFTRTEDVMLKKAPKDFDPNHEAIENLKLKSFTTTHRIEDSIFLEKNAAELIAKKLIVLKPLNNFLSRALETEN